ncbi:capsid protein [Phascolarctid gammaherpesvirus 1]|uniref:Capsid protein n=1 Tax=Phascolarctid gammaherpesvirus 1 TaxID=2249313 RepID=A0A3S5HA21_9GAMA|nr:capsid protein [Phascolarctid gammaherpesvirus 1]AZB49237.1 capsid protein [Phascolarctid gammaherpesvirus 1]
MNIPREPIVCPEVANFTEFTETRITPTRPPYPDLEDKIELDFPDSVITQKLKDIPKGNQSDSEFKKTRRLYVVYLLASRCYEELRGRTAGIVRKKHYTDTGLSRTMASSKPLDDRVPSVRPQAQFIMSTLPQVSTSLQTGGSSFSIIPSVTPLPDDNSLTDEDSELVPTGPKGTKAKKK